MLFQALLKCFLALSQAQDWEELISRVVVRVWTIGNPTVSHFMIPRILTPSSSVTFLSMCVGVEMIAITIECEQDDLDQG